MDPMMNDYLWRYGQPEEPTVEEELFAALGEPVGSPEPWPVQV